MEYRILGCAGFEVSRLCFGALTVGPLQADLPVDQGARIIREAAERGVNFFDTAELYRTYAHLRQGLDGLWDRVHVASKSYAVDGPAMAKSVQAALKGLDTDCLSIFMLHEIETEASLRGHAGALEYLVKAKERGLIRAVGVSTHHVEGVWAAALRQEIDVIQPLINSRGIGIKGGGVPEMLEAIQLAATLGKGVYAMKPLGGGHLRSEARPAFDFLLSRSEIASVAVGMRSVAEVRLNALLFDPCGKEDATLPDLAAAVGATERFLHVQDWCQGCGSCVAACPSQALELREGRAQVDAGKCVLCGYCGAACPEMAIKIV